MSCWCVHDCPVCCSLLLSGRAPRAKRVRSSAASEVYKGQEQNYISNWQWTQYCVSEGACQYVSGFLSWHTFARNGISQDKTRPSQCGEQRGTSVRTIMCPNDTTHMQQVHAHPGRARTQSHRACTDRAVRNVHMQNGAHHVRCARTFRTMTKLSCLFVRTSAVIWSCAGHICICSPVPCRVREHDYIKQKNT